MSLSKVVTHSDIGDILEKAMKNEKLGYDDCVRLLESNDIHLMGMVANTIKKRIHGDKVTFVNNLILNYTNVCITYCKFCAFYRPPNHEESYTISAEECVKRVSLAKQLYNITQVLIQGGHNPSLKIEYYEQIFRAIKEKCSGVSIHGLSPSEIDMIARVERSSIREIISRLKDAGLDSVPGAGAEILVDEVRDIISPLKINSDRWLRIMEEVHRTGLSASATMMYGHIETVEQRARSLMKIIDLQEKTGGFMAFIPWSFEPNKTDMQKEGLVRYTSGGLTLLKMIAVSRIMLNGIIEHMQSSWLTNGIGMAQMALLYGADDFGGTLHGEEVVTATGSRSTTLTSENIINAVKQLGLPVAERDNFYRVVRYH